VLNSTSFEHSCLILAKASIMHGFKHGAPWIPNPSVWSHLVQKAFVFVTVTHQSQTIGCQGVDQTMIGLATLQAAWRSVFGDLRDGSITQQRIRECDLEVSVLTPHQTKMCPSQSLAPMIQSHHSVGVVWGGLQATMLNTVQQSCVNSSDFLAHVLRKAKITQDHGHLEWTVYNTTNIGPVQWNQIELPDCLLI
jgi:AMMECR1 domain-containing protein